MITLLLAATITLTAPENSATYDTHTPCVNEFLSHPAEGTFPWFLKVGTKYFWRVSAKDESDEAERQYNCLGFEHFGCQHVYHPIYPYHIGLPDMKPKIAEIFCVMTKKENYPIYFHCAVGSDRTGTIGVLLDGILGRTDEQIYNDYKYLHGIGLTDDELNAIRDIMLEK